MLNKAKRSRYKRYCLSFIRHLTWKKLLNLLKIEYRLFTRNIDLSGTQPYFITVDISNACNLRCPLCTMGRRATIPRKNLMTFENYVSIIAPIKDYLFFSILYNWGEPFLNKDVYKIIKWNTDANIATYISSNLNLAIDADTLVQSGLEHLTISGDGISQEVYSKYRIGGDIEAVKRNLKNIVEARRRHGSNKPHIEWQCLVNRYNEPTLPDIKNNVLSWGADEVRFSNLNFLSAGSDHKSMEDEWLPQDPIYREFSTDSLKRARKARKCSKTCFWLWRTSVINSDGGVMPCHLHDVPEWGNAMCDPFSKVWNNDNYIEARTRFSKGDTLKNRDVICDKCEFFRNW